MMKEKQSAPEFTLESMDGVSVALSDILSKGPAVIAFFKISCPVCQMAFPYLERLHSAAGDAGLQFYAVSQDSREATKYFIDDYALTLPTLLDTYGGGYAVSNAYGIRTVPSVLVIEPDGQISRTMEGFEKAGLQELGDRIGSPAFDPGEDVPAFRPG
jgi:peroxiredoxin